MKVSRPIFNELNLILSTMKRGQNYLLREDVKIKQGKERRSLFNPTVNKVVGSDITFLHEGIFELENLIKSVGPAQLGL